MDEFKLLIDDRNNFTIVNALGEEIKIDCASAVTEDLLELIQEAGWIND